MIMSGDLVKIADTTSLTPTIAPAPMHRGFLRNVPGSNDLRSAPRLRYFFASWCPDCEPVTEVINAWANLYRGKMNISGIHHPVGPKEIQSVFPASYTEAELNGRIAVLQFDVMLDYPLRGNFVRRGETIESYFHETKVPRIALIDDQGNIVEGLGRYEGNQAIEELRKKISQLVG